MSKKIGWESYEQMLKKQMSSPIASNLMLNSLDEMEDLSEDVENTQLDIGMLTESDPEILAIPVPESFYAQLQLLTNYQSWIGHTNFNITPTVKDQIEKIEGVEILEVMSRYRFFVGVGKMFEFSDVRKKIEHKLTRGSNED